jgi:hypothetical protein
MLESANQAGLFGTAARVLMTLLVLRVSGEKREINNP